MRNPIKHGLNPQDTVGRGLDPSVYVGDEGGALWSGLCNSVKDKTISDTFHVKQDVPRHLLLKYILLKYFTDEKDKIHSVG